ncbi:MAG: hypothetical protein K2N48_00760 [Muribaculaceae bacterium]|nr:hypothetical protein [Muribaculaceae bacterium]
MKLTIHRGSDQIGGCITEYELDGWKLFVDFGDQLPGNPSSDEPLLIEGLNCGDISKSTLLITHYHGDHIGKIAEADSSIPVYMGHIAHDIYCKLQHRLNYINGEAGEKAKATLERCQNVKTFFDGEKFTFGPFVIEPVKMDHSAYDAYGFIIENKDNDEDIVFHTGDFRAHGLSGDEFYHKITSIPTVKAIVCEGTNIEKDNPNAEPEYKIEDRFRTLFKEHKYNVVFVSSTNIDRLFGIYRAAEDAGRPILMDEYQLDILKSVIGENDWSRNDEELITDLDENGEEESYTSQAVYEFGKEKPIVLEYDRTKRDTPTFFIPDKLRRLLNWKGCVLIARSTPQYQTLIDTFSKDKTQKYLSMWNGYLNPASPAYNKNLAKAIGQEYKYIHTSGHADPHTLEQMFKEVDANMIIPMHTSNPKKFLEQFPENDWQIRLIKDGETIDLEKEDYWTNKE